MTSTRRAFSVTKAETAGLAVDRFPEGEEELAKAEEAISKALEALSVQDREMRVFDLHGIDTIGMIEDDDPEAVEAKLKELDKHLNLVREKAAYERAKQLNADYVDGRAFRLMCLRAERYNAAKAAELLVYHLEQKQALFGSGDVLARDIRVTDLHPDDIEIVKTGFLQVCQQRDLAGRTVMNYIAKQKKYKNLHHFCRAFWYIFMCALRDEEAQKNGIVMVFQNYGNTMEGFQAIKYIREIETALPMPVVGSHFCYSNSLLWPVISGIKLFHVATSEHDRFKPHFGAPKDVAFELQTFGIPVDCCPAEEPDLVWNEDWLYMQQMHEEQESNVRAVIVPRRYDVLFGKGKKARDHPGTIRCQYLVEMTRDRYEAASRQEKTAVADQIMAAVRESGGRFLRCEKGLWIEVEHSIGREKISHWFRHLRSKNINNSTGTNSSQSTGEKRAPVADMEDSLQPNKRAGLVLG